MIAYAPQMTMKRLELKELRKRRAKSNSNLVKTLKDDQKIKANMIQGDRKQEKTQTPIQGQFQKPLSQLR
jgi:hypothetical protein